MGNINYLASARKQFEQYKLLGEKTINQVPSERLFWQYNEESNSIAIIINHLSGNMLSRWTDFLASEGEKEWRNRDAEFVNSINNKEELLERWNKGWTCLFAALNSISDNDLQNEIFIRNEKHTVLEAINRQLTHYPYHIGQIVFIGKMICDTNWQTLSIAKGRSKEFNAWNR